MTGGAKMTGEAKRPLRAADIQSYAEKGLNTGMWRNADPRPVF